MFKFNTLPSPAPPLHSGSASVTLWTPKAFELAPRICTFLSKYAHAFGPKQYSLDQINCSSMACSEIHAVPETVVGGPWEAGLVIGSGIQR